MPKLVMIEEPKEQRQTCNNVKGKKEQRKTHHMRRHYKRGQKKSLSDKVMVP
jgi:hypothetical protein